MTVAPGRANGQPECGNGVVEGSEACDDGLNSNSDDWSLEVHCNATCTALGPHCGDGQVDAPDEACDLGANGPCVSCSARCEAQVVRCGDGEICGGEVCDDGLANSDAWAPGVHCNASCTGLAPHCGDGNVDEPFEECEGSDPLSACDEERCGLSRHKTLWKISEDSPPVEQFVLTGDVALDTATDLSWYRSMVESSNPNTSSCADLDVGGHDDWREPTIVEIMSVLDFGRSNPAINPAVFDSIPSERFWISGPVLARFRQHAVVDMTTGSISSESFVASDLRFLCVRGGAFPAFPELQERITQFHGTARDNLQGLLWQTAPGSPMGHDAATLHCDGLTLGELDGWRLPSIKELAGWIQDAFDGDPSREDLGDGALWSATPLASSTESFWVLRAEGQTGPRPPDEPASVLCVAPCDLDCQPTASDVGCQCTNGAPSALLVLLLWGIARRRGKVGS